MTLDKPCPRPFRRHSDDESHYGVSADVEADIRWRDWQARGAAGDLRTAARMRKVMLLVVAALIVWFVVQLT